jgi:hypothetical protein
VPSAHLATRIGFAKALPGSSSYFFFLFLLDLLILAETKPRHIINLAFLGLHGARSKGTGLKLVLGCRRRRRKLNCIFVFVHSKLAPYSMHIALLLNLV